MALVVGGTTVTGTQTLDATKLTGDLPNISGASLTGISSAPTAITSGIKFAYQGAAATETAPNPGVCFIWFPQVGTNTLSGDNVASTIGSAKDGGTASATNYSPDTPMRARWVKISY